jgi:uncharacterized protein (TIGR00251 family)
MIALEARTEGVIISVRVNAGAKRTGIAGEHDGALRIDVSVAPEKGKANRAVGDVLAELFGITKSEVQLLSGATSRQKRFLLAGIERQAALHKLDAALQTSN